MRQVRLSKQLWTNWPLMSLLLLCFALLACNQDTTEGAESKPPFGMPSIEIISPQDGEVWSEDALVVKVEVKNFIMDPAAIGLDKVPGRGHWHVYLDGEWVGANAGNMAVLERVSPGLHHLRVSLANNDHSPVVPVVEDTLIVDKASIVDKPSDDSATTDSFDDPYELPDSVYEEPEWTIPEQDASPHFIGSNPRHGEEIYQDLEAIEISFDFELAPESEIELTHNGEPVPLGPVEISSDNFSMSAPIIEDIESEGVYEVSYRACWPYLNCHTGSFAFVVESEQ